jgi:hypothetical protein
MPPTQYLVGEHGPETLVSAPSAAPVRIRVPQVGGEVVHYAGAEPTTFKVNDAGEITVAPSIAADILAGIPGSFIVAEAPPQPDKPAAPAKE